MERRKRTAIVLLATTLPGVAAAEVRDHLVPRDDVADIPQDARPISGPPSIKSRISAS
jgi:hypothetical protein